MSLLVANDNIPCPGEDTDGQELPKRFHRQYASGYAQARADHALLVTSPSKPQTRIPQAAPVPASRQEGIENRLGAHVKILFALAALCAGALAIALYVCANIALGEQDIFMACAAMTGWSLSGLALGLAGRTYFQSLLSMIGYSAALAGLFGAAYFTCISMNIMPSPQAALWVGAGVTLALWRILDEPFFLLVSGLVAAGLCVLCLSQFSIANDASQTYWALPAYLIILCGGAARAKFGLVLGLCTLAAWAVIGSLAYSQTALGQVNLSLAAGTLFAIAGLQFAAGKLQISGAHFGGRLNNVFGWLAALGTAFIIQSEWLGTQPTLLETLDLPSHSTMASAWIFKLVSISASAFTAILLAGHYLKRHMSFTAFIAGLVCCCALPLLTVYQDTALRIWQVTALPAAPHLGLLIGAGLCAAAASAFVYGAARKDIYLSLIGFAALGAQVFLLWGYVATNENALLSFVYPALIGLLFAAMAWPKSAGTRKARSAV